MRKRQDEASGVALQVAQWKDNESGEAYKAWYETPGAKSAKVLLISPMASTGVSVRFTNVVHVLEPFFSPFRRRAVGRHPLRLARRSAR